MNSYRKTIKNKRIITEQDAHNIADLYITYYKQINLTKENFLMRWSLANKFENHFLYAAYLDTDGDPLGFIDFSIIASIFWSPSLIRIDSIYIKDIVEENEILDSLFDTVLLTAKTHNVSMISGASCFSYEQEVRILKKKIPIDNNPNKAFFTLIIS